MITPSSTEDTTANYVEERYNVQDPYAGLNRAQRRKAMSVEGRAFRKKVNRLAKASRRDA